MPPIRKALLVPTAFPLGHFPASAALSPVLFPIVDRDGLTKPLIQLIAEEAIDSGINTIGVVGSPELESGCRQYLQDRREAVARELPGEDWAALECEKLVDLDRKLRFVADGAGAIRAFAGDEPVLVLPMDTVPVSGTKDRVAGQLIDRVSACDASVAVAVRVIHVRDAWRSTVLAATPEPVAPGIHRIDAIEVNPAPDRTIHWPTSPLPPGYLWATAGPCIVSSRALAAMGRPRDLMADAVRAACGGGSAVAVEIAGQVIDVRRPYGWLEAQLALGLAGIHRVELCEMIARTLAEQAKN